MLSLLLCCAHGDDLLPPSQLPAKKGRNQTTSQPNHTNKQTKPATQKRMRSKLHYTSLMMYSHECVFVVLVDKSVINAFLSAICKTSAAPTHAT